MSNNRLSSRVSNAGSSGSGSSGRKAPPPPRLSGPAAAAGSECLLDIPEQQSQGQFAVPTPPEELAPEVSNGNSQTQEKNESRRSSSSSPGESTSKDKVDDEAVKQSMAILQQQFKVRADESKSLQARLKKAEEKTRSKKRECEDLSSKQYELLKKCSAQSTELALVQGEMKTTQELLTSSRENEKEQHTLIQEQSAKIRMFEHEKERWQATIQEQDQEIGNLKRELDQERSDNDFIAQNIATMHEQFKRKKSN